MFEGMIVLGENINATRKVKVEGIKTRKLDDGRVVLPYKDLDGEEALLDLTEASQSEQAAKSGMVGHIAAGIVQRDEPFIASMAQQQVQAGADILDVCVDECSPWSKERVEHMQWAVKTIQKNVRVPLAIDSSDPDAIRAGIEVYEDAVGKPMINSVNLEEARLPILAIAAELGAAVLANGSGRTGLPNDIEGRVNNLTEMMKLMDEAGIALEDRTLDPLVLPVGTNPEHGVHFLESCRILREKFGPAFHMTGGISNISFGLPKRKLLNEAFTYLAREHGADTAFIDPLQVRAFAPEDEGFQKAMAALKGEDPYCAMYVAYCRGM